MPLASLVDGDYRPYAGRVRKFISVYSMENSSARYANTEANRVQQEDYRQFIEVTVGCTHNSCKFCNFYRGYQFRMVPLVQIESDLKPLLFVGCCAREI